MAALPPKTPAELEELENQSISVSIDAAGGMFFNRRTIGSAAVIEAGVAGFLANARRPEERMVVFRCDKHVDK